MSEKQIYECGGAVDNPRYYDTIAIDFDGTLCEYDFPEIGEPKQHVIAFIKYHATRGTKIILHTCRENGTRRALLDEAVHFCNTHEIPIYAVNENPHSEYSSYFGIQPTGRKVFADLYIDDKAVNVREITHDMVIAQRFAKQKGV